MTDARSEQVPAGVWQHWKHPEQPRRYLVLGLAHDANAAGPRAQVSAQKRWSRSMPTGRATPDIRQEDCLCSSPWPRT